MSSSSSSAQHQCQYKVYTPSVQRVRGLPTVPQNYFHRGENLSITKIVNKRSVGQVAAHEHTEMIDSRKMKKRLTETCVWIARRRQQICDEDSAEVWNTGHRGHMSSDTRGCTPKAQKSSEENISSHPIAARKCGDSKNDNRRNSIFGFLHTRTSRIILIF